MGDYAFHVEYQDYVLCEQSKALESSLWHISWNIKLKECEVRYSNLNASMVLKVTNKILVKQRAHVTAVVIWRAPNL